MHNKSISYAEVATIKISNEKMEMYQHVAVAMEMYQHVAVAMEMYQQVAVAMHLHKYEATVCQRSYET